ISLNPGPITKIVRNSAIPGSTWLGGELCSPRALRVSDSTTSILVNEVTSSSADGAIDSTVIARIRVTAWLGLLPPTEMFTPLPAGTGGVGGVGATGALGAAQAGSASRNHRATTASISSGTAQMRRRYREATQASEVRADARSRKGRAARQ